MAIELSEFLARCNVKLRNRSVGERYSVFCDGTEQEFTTRSEAEMNYQNKLSSSTIIELWNCATGQLLRRRER